jgi:hypothetical protein
MGQVMRHLRPLALVAFTLVAATAEAQRLGIDGQRFTVDGSPRFLTFISYFGAMGARDVAADLEFLKSSGFDGVRIWPNSPEGPQLMRGDGQLDPDNLARLTTILERARDRRMIVDITFTAEHVAGLSAGVYRDAMVRAAGALRPYANVLIDIENERNLYGPFGRPLAAQDVAVIVAAIKGADASRIVTASNSQDLPPADAARFTTDTGLDVIAYHDPRRPSWFEADQIDSVVSTLATARRPVYLQEPTRFPNPSTDRAEYFRTALANARRAGAAAWCFHTDLGFNLGGSLFQDRLRSRVEPEWTFVSTLVPHVWLRASDGHYLTAVGGGGGAVTADRQTPAAWETFTIRTLEGGLVLPGDRVNIWTADGLHLLQASAGGGSTLTAAGATPGPWEAFLLERISGPSGAAAITSGDAIALRTAGATWYVTAERGGGGPVNANKAVRGEWETFLLGYLPGQRSDAVRAVRR